MALFKRIIQVSQTLDSTCEYIIFFLIEKIFKHILKKSVAYFR